MFLPAQRIVYGDEQTPVFFVLAFSCHLQCIVKYIGNVRHTVSCHICLKRSGAFYWVIS